MDKNRCPFCDLKPRIILENDFAMSFLDEFPLTQGHTLVVPKRHVASLFDLSKEEQAAVWTLLGQVRRKLLADIKPDAFTIGLNDGPAAGQTVMHAHVHVIPRQSGDVADPRGGIRWIMPSKAPYWVEDKK